MVSSNILRGIGLSVSLAVLLLGYQNCGQGFDQASLSEPSQSLSGDSDGLTPTPTPAPTHKDFLATRTMNAALIARIPTVMNRAKAKATSTIADANAVTGSPASMPRSTVANGTWRMVRINDPTDWTSGFFPGMLWQIYKYDGTGLTNARTFTTRLASLRAPKTANPPMNYLHANLGFDMKLSYQSRLLYDAASTTKTADETILMRAANDLRGLFHTNIGAIIDRGDWEVSGTDAYVPVDYIMVTEPLFWASKQSGNPAYANMAIQHATTIMNNHIRNDGSSFHHVLFNAAGTVLSRKTHQGFSNTSTWTRGQSWGVYGFTMTYRETRRPEFLRTAQRMADYYLSRWTPGALPPYDFDDNRTTVPRDSSSATILAAGLIELSELSTEVSLKEKYLKAAEDLLNVVTTTALGATNVRGLVTQGTGHRPYNSEVNVSLIYGDYYLLEAINRYRDQVALKAQ